MPRSENSFGHGLSPPPGSARGTPRWPNTRAEDQSSARGQTSPPAPALPAPLRSLCLSPSHPPLRPAQPLPTSDPAATCPPAPRVGPAGAGLARCSRGPQHRPGARRSAGEHRRAQCARMDWGGGAPAQHLPAGLSLLSLWQELCAKVPSVPAETGFHAARPSCPLSR